MTSHIGCSLPPALLVPDRVLSVAELSACALDGDLVRWAGAYLPIDSPPTIEERAAVMAATIGDARVIISDAAAAWVRGWVEHLGAVTTSAPITARIPSTERRRLRTREVVIDDDEWVEVGSVRLTTVTRTLNDLARHADDRIIDVLAAGIALEGIIRSDLDLFLARRPTASFQRRARARLLRAWALSRC